MKTYCRFTDGWVQANMDWDVEILSITRVPSGTNKWRVEYQHNNGCARSRTVFAPDELAIFKHWAAKKKQWLQTRRGCKRRKKEEGRRL